MQSRMVVRYILIRVLRFQLMPMGNRLAEMARMRLEYDEARKKIQNIQQQLADLEEKVTPGQAESDKDR